MNNHRNTLIPKIFSQNRSTALSIVSLMHDVNIALRWSDFRLELTPKINQTLHSDGKSNCRGGLSTQQLYQSIITSTAANRCLRTQFVGNPFKNRQIVIVEPSHHPRIEGIGYPRIIQASAYAFIMLAGCFAQKIKQFGSSISHFLHRGIFSVQNAQRIAIHAT